MSYNGSGTFQINTAGQPVVAGTVISSTAFNSLTSDLATGLSTAITKDGQTTPTANIPLGNNKIINLGNGTAATDAAAFGQLQAGTEKLITVSGTDTITGTMNPTLTAYATGNMFSFVAANTNTGAVTININSLGAKAITKIGSTALAAGDIVAGAVILIEYDGTQFQYVNLAASGNVVGPASSTANAIPTFSGTTGKLLQNNTSVKIVSNNITMDGSTSGTLTIAAAAVAGTNTVTLPAATDTLVGKATTDTLTNKTLTSPIINGSSAPTNGVYLPTTNTLGFATNSTQVATINATGVLAFNSGYGSVAAAYGCRAWVNFNGTGTVAIRASGNVTSITDNGTGNYTVNFTTAMPDANYCLAGSASRAPLAAPRIVAGATSVPATGSVQIQSGDDGGTPNDCEFVNIAIFR